VQRWHATMAKNFTVRLPDDEATNVEALARAEELSLNEPVRRALVEAVEARRADPEFKSRVQRIIEEDRELLERLAR
jgi:ribosomal protein S3AE